MLIQLFRLFLLYVRSNRKTFVFNLHYFPFRKAVYLPVKIHKKCILHALKGTVTLPDKVYPSMIQIGFSYVGIFDVSTEKTIWENKGSITFEGKAKLGAGSRISTGTNGILTIGSNFTITAKSTLICFKRVTIGGDVLFSWDVLLMDTDFHDVVDMKDKIINPSRPIIIGSHCWIGCRAVLLKGTEIVANTIIAANSIVTGKFVEENTIIGKNPAEIIKRDINWIV